MSVPQTGPLKHDFLIYQGSTFRFAIALTVDGAPLPADWTARSQIRRSVRSETVLAELDPVVTTGRVSIEIPAAVSSAWTWNKGVYDLEVTNPDGSVTVRAVSGAVEVDLEVTR